MLKTLYFRAFHAFLLLFNFMQFRPKLGEYPNTF